ncbi:MAG TPA: hypothetical protein VMF61_03175 [Candidatus Acidoferrales bacterium]|nr:hypothetical protein [Candidatus Acidoferrales bacterium]
MKVRCFSSFTFSYLNRARVLFHSLKRFAPHWTRVALITDKPPPGLEFPREDDPFDEIVYAEDLPIPNFASWIFKHDVIEACTAVKGPFSADACSTGADAVVYLDPDTCLFAPLDPVERILESSSILLTPHIAAPEREFYAILDNEMGSLRTGTYNLGFCAFRTDGEGARFARWWADRLLAFCYDDIPAGLFVDQRWCDLVPAIFDGVAILRDPGYNVASWNLSNRRVSMRPDGSFAINGVPLRFWHFTKLGEIADVMTKRYAKDNFQVYEIWNWYRRQVHEATDPEVPAGYWAYDRYRNGARIERSHRLAYRADPKLQLAYPDPFAAGASSFFESQVLDAAG